MPRRISPHFSLTATTCLVGLAASSAAFGAVGLSPLRFFPGGSPFVGVAPTTQSVAINSRGDVIVGEEVRTQNGTLVTPTVRFRNGARGPWSQTLALARPTTDTSEPLVAINGRGSRIAVFHRAGKYVASRQRPNGWKLSAINAPAPTTEDVTALAVTATGRGRFVHALPDTGCDPDPAICPWRVWIYDQATPGSLWVRDGDSLPIAAAQRPSLSVNSRGDVLVAWATTGASGRVNAARRLDGEPAFEAALPVSSPGVRGDVSAALGSGGDAAIAWVHPDAPGSGTGFTGRIDVAVRGRSLPVWAAPETAVPAGTPNPDVDLAIDSSANITLAWTAFPASAGAPLGIDATVRSSATSTWVPSPRLDSAAVGDGESIELGDVLAGGGRSFVIYEKHLGPGANISRLAVGGPSGWKVNTLAGNVDPTAASSDGPRPVPAVAPNGNVILVGNGMQVRNFDGARTLLAARATGLRVIVTGRSAEMRFRLNTQARIFVLRSSGANFRTVGQYPAVILPAGANHLSTGRLAVGRYRVGLGVCNRSRGCTATRFVEFRIR